MKRILLLSIAGLGLLAGSATAQIYSGNVVGYINYPFMQGDNLFANQLSFSNNLLSQIFNPSTPDGTTVRLWDSATLSYQPASVFDANVQLWSIDYALPLGLGAMLSTPQSFTNTFVGEVIGWVFGSGQPPLVQTDGYQLLGCTAPLIGTDFYQVVGRDPREGESVTRLNRDTHQYYTTTFLSGDWDNGAPKLGICEAGFFNLGPVSVPEPSSLGLLAVGLVACLSHRARK